MILSISVSGVLSTMKSVIVVLVLAGIQVSVTQHIQYQATSLPTSVLSESGAYSCPTPQQRENAVVELNDKIMCTLRMLSPIKRGNWTRVAYLNMSDPMQSCPPAWRDRSANGVRVCGRPTGSNDECHSTSYSTCGQTFTRVYGRVIEYQFGSPDGFHSSIINDSYVEGVSITHGSSRSHIWTLAAYRSEVNNGCPCKGGSSAPLFVGSNYYCESGYNGTVTPPYVLHTSDPLWDGEQCESEGSCCSTAPWFTVDLVNPTSDDIEVRICSDYYEYEEDAPIHLLELYIQ